MAHYVYILQSLRDNEYYGGKTLNVEARLSFHNKGLQRSTRNRIPFRLVLVEKYENRSFALKREKEIKSWKAGVAFKNSLRGRSPAIGGVPRSGCGVAGSNPVYPTKEKASSMRSLFSF